MEKVAKMPATLDDNRPLGALEVGEDPGGQLITFRISYLDLLRKLQFDTKDTSVSALCGSYGTLRNILELICNEPVEFNLRLYHGFNGDVREWLPGSDNVI